MVKTSKRDRSDTNVFRSCAGLEEKHEGPLPSTRSMKTRARSVETPSNRSTLWMAILREELHKDAGGTDQACRARATRVSKKAWAFLHLSSEKKIGGTRPIRYSSLFHYWLSRRWCKNLKLANHLCSINPPSLILALVVLEHLGIVFH